MKQPKLTLIIPYRKRKEHLLVFLEWFCDPKYSDFEAIIIESDENSEIGTVVSDYENIRYIHCQENSNSVFHLAKYLNIGLNNSKSDLICPFDIDLIPIDNSLIRHYEVAASTPHIVTGYRLNISLESWNNPNISELEVCSEDYPSALKKHLTTHEKFGVCPIFSKEKIINISGWDENFVGWGAEDQDLTERYLEFSNCEFLRSPNFVYLHIKHDYHEFWKREEVVKNNRKYYQSKNSYKSKMNESK